MAYRPARFGFHVLLAIGTIALGQWVLAGKSVSKGLDIYMVDVEGGGATLFVTPAGQAVLIDGGWMTSSRRDSTRILETAHRAGVKRFDYVIVSHYHSDHLGGIVELAQRMQIDEFLDHGLMTHTLPNVSPELYSEYLRLSKGRRHSVSPGEVIRLRALGGEPPPSLLVLASDGLTYHKRNAPHNPACAEAKPGPVDEGENANSVAVMIRFGAFRYFDGTDLPWKKEAQLVCPQDDVGTANIYQVDHHGKDTSNNPVLVATLNAQAAVMNNGPKKGGDPATFQTLLEFFHAQDIFQVHRNLATGKNENAPLANIANPIADDGGFGLHIHVNGDGTSFEIDNDRTRMARQYDTVH